MDFRIRLEQTVKAFKIVLKIFKIEPLSMKYNKEKAAEEVMEALNFSNSKIRDYLIEKNIEEMKIILRSYDPADLNMLSEISLSYEQYEICQAVRDILKEKKIKDV